MDSDQTQPEGQEYKPELVAAWKEHCAAAKRASEQGRYHEAAAQYEAALREAESFGFSDPRFASTLNGLAGAYSAARRTDEAETLYQHLLSLRKSAFGQQSMPVAQTMNELAALYAAAHKWAEAERAYNEALAITEAVRGPEDISLCASLNNLALLYKNQQRTDEALPLFQRALRIGLKYSGQTNPFISASLNNLAAICVERKRYAEAEALFKRSLAIKEKSHGPAHPDVATILNNLGELYCATGRGSEARSLFERVLHIDEAAWGANHSEVAADLMRLASLAEAEGDRVDARRRCARAMEIRESTLGHEHPLTAKSRRKLSQLASQPGESGEANRVAPVGRTAPPQAKTLAITAAELGLRRPGAAQSLCELAERAASEGRWLEAEGFYQRELEIERSLRGEEDACVAATQNNLGVVKQSQASFEEAAKLFQASLATWVGLGESRRAALVLNNLAVVCAARKNRSGAETLYRRSMEFHQGTSGLQPDQLAVIAANLAVLQAPEEPSPGMA